MSGRKISDHSFWAGKGGKDSVFPMGSKMKQEHSAEGAGALGKYEDTTEAIRAAQVVAEKKAKAHSSKEMYRN